MHIFGLLLGHFAVCLAMAFNNTITGLDNLWQHDCSRISVRKEYRDMSELEWSKFYSALMKMQTMPSRDNQTYTEWDRYTSLHINYGHKFHNSRLFMHWHRTFTAAFEKVLQRIDPDISMPYWDYSYDWQNAEASPIMTPIYGLDVSTNSTGDCRYKRRFQTPHCIVRGYTPGNFSRLPSDEFVNLVLDRVPEYKKFNEFLEKSIHNPIHVSLGGDMNKQEAPNDPIFWFIHAFVDKVWVDWQQRNRTSDLTPSERATILPPFGVTADYVENTGNLCYKYQPFSKARKFPPRMM